LCIGNEKANAIWEKGLAMQKGWKKPDSSADRKAREGYIKSKYLWKGFLAYSESDGKTDAERAENFSRALFEAAKASNLLSMSEAIAFGANVDWANRDEDNKTALQLCVLKEKGDMLDWSAVDCVELLLQHGAKMEVGESATTHILDFAKREGAEPEMVEYLWTKLPETEKRDRLGLLLYEATKSRNMDGMAEALAKGASVNWKNAKDGGKSSLHVCALVMRPKDDSKWNAIECLELLLLRGGQLDALDNDGHNVMDCAVIGGAEREMIEFLATKLT
jgi:ankyrin repeat protein